MRPGCAGAPAAGGYKRQKITIENQSASYNSANSLGLPPAGADAENP
jgi:hypothetical protein